MPSNVLELLPVEEPEEIKDASPIDDDDLYEQGDAKEQTLMKRIVSLIFRTQPADTVRVQLEGLSKLKSQSKS